MFFCFFPVKARKGMIAEWGGKLAFVLVCPATPGIVGGCVGDFRSIALQKLLKNALEQQQCSEANIFASITAIWFGLLTRLQDFP